jgi:hypothetical protein
MGAVTLSPNCKVAVKFITLIHLKLEFNNVSDTFHSPALYLWRIQILYPLCSRLCGATAISLTDKNLSQSKVNTVMQPGAYGD